MQALKCNVVKRGTCHLEIGQERWRLEEGACFLISANLPFLIGTDLNRPPRSAELVFGAGTRNTRHADIDAGTGPEFFCLSGRMDLSDDAGLLLGSLPPVVVVRADDPVARRLHWLVDRLEEELTSGLAGASAMAAQIMQMVFIELIRHVSDGQFGSWLAALAEPRIGAALKAMHRDPERSWRIDDLAGIAHLSRSRFSARFRTAVGHAPMDYLLRLRMALAHKALARPGTSIAAVTAQAGYSSESAFGSAFRRITGLTPRQAQKKAGRVS